MSIWFFDAIFISTGTSMVKRYLSTVYALSTPPGRSAIAVVRISGPQCSHIFGKLTNSANPPPKRRATLRNLYDPQSGVMLDQSLCLYFEEPKTFTGEDILELHLHGGRAVVNSVLKSIASLHDRNAGVDIRYALPGEFSKRAFQNGRFDLTEIEGIGELIDSETEMQRIAALSSVTGANKHQFIEWREQIVDNVAMLTAIIDFGEDTEIDDIDKIMNKVSGSVDKLEGEIKRYLDRVCKSEILQSGIKMVLLGPPNAGKSSLLNQLTNDDTAIVSNIPGTTRDSLNVAIDINGYKVMLWDTAGIRESTTDEIEIQGIKRAQNKAAEGDLVVLVVDPSQPLLPALKQQVKQYKDVVIVVNKNDLPLGNIVQELEEEFGVDVFTVSCKTRNGIDDLTKALTQKFKTLSDVDPITISKRAQEILSKDVLYGFREFHTHKEDIVIASESLQFAADGIGKITGQTVGVEEVLGVVFANFCVGK